METKLTIEEIQAHEWTIDEVEDEIKKVYILVDTGIIKALSATVISNRIKSQGSPVWLLILAGSSGGKSIMLNLFSKCGPWITPIDTLTTNTFASGLKRDDETSLLHKLKNGIMVFKDFTVLTTMNEDALRELMGQFRAIFDGTFDKKTGNNVDVEWKGKIGCIAAGTIEVQRKMRQFSQQGERFLNYVINVADSKEITKRAIENQPDIKEKEEYLQDIMSAFINQKILSMSIKNISMSPEIRNEIIEVANFCTLARSPVIMSKKDTSLVEFVPSREEPARMAVMMMNLATALVAQVDAAELNQKNAFILYKIGLDSIPVERRMCLKVLAEYRNSSTQSISVKLRMPTETVKGWLTQLNALGVIDKRKDNQAFIWQIKQEYREIMVKYLDLKPVDSVLDNEDENEFIDNNPYTSEDIKQLNEDAKQLMLGEEDGGADNLGQF